MTADDGRFTGNHGRADRTRRKLIALVMMVGLMLSPIAGHAGPGDPDTGFSGDGVAVVDVNRDDGGVDAMVDSSGRTVTVGFTTAAGGRSQVMVVRHTPEGGRDRQFSGDGIATFDLGRPAYGTALDIDSAGRILVAGIVQGQGVR